MKKLKFVLIIISTIIVICGIGVVISYLLKKDKVSFKESVTINIGDKIPTIKSFTDEENYNKVKNIKIRWKDIKIEDNTTYYTGIYRGIFNYKEKAYDVKLIVKDTEPPKINNVSNIETYETVKADLYKGVTFTDNSKDEIKKEIVGEYNFDKKGEYNLKYIATDKSNNKTEKEFKLTVKSAKKLEVKIGTVGTDKTEFQIDLSGTSSKGYKITKNKGAYYVNNILIANKTYPLDKTYNPGGLISTFMNNYNKMNEDAKAQGINLRIISGFRSYQTQVTLYNNYVNRDGQEAADRYSARAGHSEHQSGLAADINSLEQSWENTKEGKWLNDNCYKYGFIIRYPKGKEHITGYMFEPWHIRYVGVDVATAIYNNGNWSTLEEYLGITSKY